MGKDKKEKPVIRVRNLDFYYGAVRALSGIQLDIKEASGHGLDRSIRLRKINIFTLPKPDE